MLGGRNLSTDHQNIRKRAQDNRLIRTYSSEEIFDITRIHSNDIVVSERDHDRSSRSLRARGECVGPDVRAGVCAATYSPVACVRVSARRTRHRHGPLSSTAGTRRRGSHTSARHRRRRRLPARAAATVGLPLPFTRSCFVRFYYNYIAMRIRSDLSYIQCKKIMFYDKY